MAQSAIQRFIHHETSGGAVLVIAAIAALVISNSPLSSQYHTLLELPVSFGIGPLTLRKDLAHFINDGLMAIFFFLVGLEIKREVLEGNLADRDQLLLPTIAALGGMLVPGLIYAWFNWDMPTLKGWAIPAATDIAFALGALSLAGRSCPASLKVFLLTLATLDDLGAIVIIALFYTSSISLIGLSLAAVCFAVLITMNRLKVDRLAPYILVGFVMWVCVLESGVHATLGGVLLAFTIPMRKNDNKPLIRAVEERLHPYVAFMILPIFAFANAGVPLANVSLSYLAEPLPIGIVAGLVIGKPVGIVLATLALVMTGFARLPPGSTWRQITGVGCLAGIGFTMSLFIGGLAFRGGDMDEVRIGVIVGSLISVFAGLAILLTIKAKPAKTQSEAG